MSSAARARFSCGPPSPILPAMRVLKWALRLAAAGGILLSVGLWGSDETVWQPVLWLRDNHFAWLVGVPAGLALLTAKLALLARRRSRERAAGVLRAAAALALTVLCSGGFLLLYLSSPILGLASPAILALTAARPDWIPRAGALGLARRFPAYLTVLGLLCALGIGRFFLQLEAAHGGYEPRPEEEALFGRKWLAEGSPHHIGVAPDGSALFITYPFQGTLRRIDLRAPDAPPHDERLSEPGGGLQEFAITADSARVLAPTFFEKGLVEVNARTGERLRTAPLECMRALDVALGPGPGRAFVGCDFDRALVEVSLATLRPRRRAPVPWLAVAPLYLAADDARGVLYAGGGFTLREIDATSLAPLREKWFCYTWIEYVPETDEIYGSCALDGTVRAVNAETFEVARVYRTDFGVRAVAVDAARGRLYVANQFRGTVQGFDLATAEERLRVHVGKRPRGVAVDPTTGTLYAASAAGVFEIFPDRAKR